MHGTPYHSSSLRSLQSAALVRPAAPLATGVTKISSVDQTNKNWLSWQRPLKDRKSGFIIDY